MYCENLQLCIVLNNMQHVREELSHLEERLELESFYEWLDSQDESTLGSQCRAMVKKLLGSADEDIYNRMSKIMTEITEKVRIDMIVRMPTRPVNTKLRLLTLCCVYLYDCKGCISLVPGLLGTRLGMHVCACMPSQTA